MIIAMITQGRRPFVEQRRRDRSLREGGGHLLMEGGGHPLWEGGGCSSRDEAVHECGGKEEQ